MRAKRVPVVPTDKEKDESEIMHMTNRGQCETEDSHKCSPKESLVPRVTTDRRSFAYDVCTDPVLIQKIHSAVEACQVPHESSETRAVNGVLENLVTSGWVKCCSSEMLGLPFGYSSTQQGSDEKRKRWQLNNTSENAVENIETTVTASDCESPEWLGCEVDSEHCSVADRMHGTCAQSVREV